MKIEKFTVGLEFWQTSLIYRGKEKDDGSGNCFTTKAEAEEDGREMAATADPVHKPRDDYGWCTRRWRCSAIEDDGSCGSAETL